MATTADEVWQLLGELIQAQKETERMLKEQREELELRFQETERLLKEQKANGWINNWGNSPTV